jgi:hypothetical protein
MPTPRRRSVTPTRVSAVVLCTAALPAVWLPGPSGAAPAATQAGLGVRATQAGLGVPATQAGLGVPATQAGTVTIFGDRTPPDPVADPDVRSVELGVRFRAAEPGWVTGVRFYKTAANTGAHTGSLWSESGTLLATGAFTGESTAGWQELVFPLPVRIDPGVDYVASYHAPTGRYPADPGGLAAPVTNGPLTAPANGTDGEANSVYTYGPATAFPTTNWRAANYWVDVRFARGSQRPTTTTSQPTTTPPTTTPPTTTPPTNGPTSSTTRPTTTTGPSPTTVTTLRPSSTTTSTRPATTTTGPTTTRPTTTTTRGPSQSPAPGVVLRPVDGGPGYFGRWANSLPTDASFFPISVWNETLNDPAGDTARYGRLGVNGYVGLWNGVNPQIAAALKASGQWAFAQPSATGAPGYGRELAGYTWFDEPDGRDLCGEMPSWLAPDCRAANGRTTPAGIQAMADHVRAVDGSRPTFGQYTKPVALGAGLDQTTRRAYVNAVDVVSYDFYPITDPWENPARNLWEQADAVNQVRDLTGRTKPVWAFIETSRLFGDSPVGRVRPTDAQIQAEVWHAIIGGARGIEYFNHNFSGDPSYTQHLLIDPTYASTAAAVAQTNSQIHALAPVINAPYADNLVTVAGGQVNVMAKYLDGAYYLFVGSRSKSPQTVSLRLNGIGTTSATVVNENRTVAVNAGTLTDTLSGETAVHIYRIG